MSSNARLQDWVILLALTGLWGSSFVLNEVALRSFPPSVIVGSRLVLAAVLLVVVLWVRGESLPHSAAGWLSVMVMAVLGTTLPFVLTVWAQQRLDSSVTGILLATMPLFVLTFSHFFFDSERLTVYRLVGFTGGFLGVLCVIGPDAVRSAGDTAALWSTLAVVVAALSYAANSIYARLVKPGRPLAAASAVMIVSAGLSLPHAVHTVPHVSSPPDVIAVVAVVMLGFLCTGLASVLYFRIVQGPGPTFLSLVHYLIPLWAVMMGMLTLGESPNALTYFGLALILGGIALSEFGPRIRERIAQRISERRRSRSTSNAGAVRVVEVSHVSAARSQALGDL